MIEKNTNNLVNVLAVVSFILTFIYLLIFVIIQVLIVPILWIASIFILISSILIRFFVIDPEKLKKVIKTTDIKIKDFQNIKELKPIYFYRYMSIGMLFCTLADFGIHIFPPSGVILFFIAHIFHIIAFSGIIHLHPKYIFRRTGKKFAIISTIFWAVIASLIYIFLILSIPDYNNFFGPISATLKIVISYFLLPYVIILTLTTVLTFYGLIYFNRTLNFRIKLSMGMSFFVFSDTMIGLSIIIGQSYLLTMLIYPTYIIAIFLLQFAVLSLRDQNEISILKI
ncbi:MAG: hypothetical protein EAX96_10525 [Candidatus Lokiarchaeota archaeon]|nr:hypothetical protein [Candidatus Lokiarchaeota archaeon]